MLQRLSLRSKIISLILAMGSISIAGFFSHHHHGAGGRNVLACSIDAAPKNGFFAAASYISPFNDIFK